MKVTTAAAWCFALIITACNSVDFKKTKGGMPYKLFPSKSGKEVDPNNFVKVHIIQEIKDSVTFSSYKTMPLYIPVSPAGTPYDFTEILPSLKQGDSVYTVQVMDTFIARNPQMIPPQFKKGDKIETFIKVLDVFKTQEEYQRDEARERAVAFDRDTTVQNQLKRDVAGINSYLSTNNITAQRTGKGTYVQTIREGTGPQAAEGKYVSVKYTGSTFAGVVFDSNTDPSKGNQELLNFQVGTPGLIRGFDEGIRMMREGGKARFYIPSTLAYGPQSPSPDIKPFENLIFDIELVKVSDQPIPSAAPQQRQPAR